LSIDYFKILGKRNKHGTPLVELRVFGRGDIERLREWVEEMGWRVGQ